MAKVVHKYRHFVDMMDWYLDQFNPDPSARLFFFGQYAGQPFDAERFRSELSEKLNRLHYPQPARIGEERTFAQVLEHAGVFAELVTDDTLRELWKSLMLKKLFERSRELRDRKESSHGVSLQEHRRRRREIEKDIKTLKKIAEKYDLDFKYDKMIERSLAEYIPISLSERGGRNGILSFTLPVPEWKARFKRRGRRRLPKSSARQPVSETRIEDKRIQALIYRTLEQRLQNPTTYQNGVDDIFLCQIAELVWAPADVRELSDGSSLQRDINRLRS
jgi:hypothetical protein